jgi:uncharacterized damage-inducible protein DinB
MKEVLLEQFSCCYDDDAWFVGIKNAIDGLTADQASWKPVGVDNSIWGNVNHIVFWNERWLQRYRGELNKPQDVENTTTFGTKETDWDATVVKLYEVMNEWREKLTAADQEKLESPVNAEDQSPFWSALAQQNIHNAYHIGQIVLLRKLQGAWDASKGVS